MSIRLRGKPHKYFQGATLLELVLVLLIAGILFVVLEVDLPSYTMDLRAQAEQLAGDIRYVQSLSMHRGERYRIHFNATGYAMTDLSGTTIIPHPSTHEDEMDLKSQITLSTEHLPNELVVFDGRGTPYITTDLPGTTLGIPAVVTLTRDTETQLITISPATGAVVVGG